jgi:hypothetical protein
MTDVERCLREIEKAESAVRECCDFSTYLWLQDWREELELLRRQNRSTFIASHPVLPARLLEPIS